MRVKGSQDEFEARLKESLSEKPRLPEGLEAALFAKAEDLLSSRREQIAAREAEARQSELARERWLQAFRQAYLRTVESFALHPDRPATAAIFAVLVVAFLSMNDRGRDLGTCLTYADLPPFPKNNDFPAQYDAQVQSERQAYEREVQDAHKKTSGGV